MTQTPTDLTRTRRNPDKLTMRFDLQPDTTERLKVVIAGGSGVPWWRRVLRWLKHIR